MWTNEISVQKFLLLFIFVIPYHQGAKTNGFRYKLTAQELTAPEMLCLSGDAESSTTSWKPSYYDAESSSLISSPPSSSKYACPTNPSEVISYPAVIMNEDGYVKVKINGMKLRDDGRRREYQKELGNRRQKVEKERETEEVVVEESSLFPETLHHLQIYLVPLDEYHDYVLQSQCCYELETNPPDWITNTDGSKNKSPKECSYNPTNNELSHDYRANAARTLPLGYTSPALDLNASQEEKEDEENKHSSSSSHGIDLSITLRPKSRGRYMVVLSNCAAELQISNDTEKEGDGDAKQKVTMVKGLKIVFDSAEITFVSKFGELPISMMGIIPFYGFMTAFYLVMSVIWWRRSGSPFNFGFASRRGATLSSSTCCVRLMDKCCCTPCRHAVNYQPQNITHNASLLGLQNAIRFLVFCETLFSALAFSYYLHLNNTSVNLDVLYGGTAAALVNWGPWSIAVALAHFGTILSCQIVVTLATDGMWLIQSNVHNNTKQCLYAMVMIWLIFFFFYGSLDFGQRRIIYFVFGILWTIFLLFNIRRSLQHLKNLVVGQSTEQIMAIGGAIVAKRSLYRKMCAMIIVFPIVFFVSFIWTWVS